MRTKLPVDRSKPGRFMTSKRGKLFWPILPFLILNKQMLRINLIEGGEYANKTEEHPPENQQR
jgi:hypothetical protein